MQEVKVKGADTSPVLSANTSREEEVDEAAMAAENLPTTDDVGETHTRKRLRMTSSAMSSPTKDAKSKDDGDSASPSNAQAAPLTACPLSSMPPPLPRGSAHFGGTSVIPTISDDDEEDRFD